MRKPTGPELEAWRGRNRYTRDALAALLGLYRDADGRPNGPRVQSYELGRASFPAHLLPKLYELGWSPPDEDTAADMQSVQPGSDPPAPRADGQSHPRVGRRQFPVLGYAGAAEFPASHGDADHEDWEEFSDQLFSPSVRRFFIRVAGDSMEETWRHGDLALMQPDSSFRFTGTYVCAAHETEGALLKLLIVRDRKLYLVPENPEYDPIALEEPGWRMVGYAIGFKRVMGNRKYHEWADIDGLRPQSKRVLRDATERLERWLESRQQADG